MAHPIFACAAPRAAAGRYDQRRRQPQRGTALTDRHADQRSPPWPRRALWV